MTGYSQILLDIEEGIATLTLNRPEKMNAFTGTMMQEVIDAFDRTDADDAVRVVIVTGAGDRAFCAGRTSPPMARAGRSPAMNRSRTCRTHGCATVAGF
jgi:enoyl-CoA hydratase/carnithine racemase